MGLVEKLKRARVRRRDGFFLDMGPEATAWGTVDRWVSVMGSVPARGDLPKVTAVVLAYNEAWCMARALSQMVGHVDEILVLDDMSTDDTVSIARGFPGVVVIPSPMDRDPARKDYGAQRQKGVDAASGDWVVMVDADEVWPRAFWERLRPLCGNDWGVDLIRLRRRNRVDGRREPKDKGLANLLFPTDWQPRLFKKDPRIRYTGRIHEVPIGFTRRLSLVDAVIDHDRPGWRLRERWAVYDSMAGKPAGTGGA